jgi:hypothetical protein
MHLNVNANDWCMFIEFHPSINILIQVGNFNLYIFFCQINDFTMRSCHLNIVHFVKSLERHKN